MKIPLLCNLHDKSLEIVANGIVVRAKLPFKPHGYVQSNSGGVLRQPVGGGAKVMIEKKIVSGTEEMDTIKNISGYAALGYMEQMYTEEPDYFLQYPNTDDLKIMALDIEVLTKGTGVFPRAHSNPIVAIGVAMVDQPDAIETFSVRNVDDDVPDADILRQFIEYVKLHDPDIIATYNGIKFDMPYILERMLLAGIDPNPMSRDGSEVTPESIGLRIHWDMWRDVNSDQTLLGLANRRLKTVAHHFGWSDIIDLGRTALSNSAPLVGTAQLDEYLRSDVRLTTQLTEVYIGNHEALAEMVGIPLREVMFAYPSLIPKVYHVRNLKSKFIGFQSNEEKYARRLGTMRYEAAKVAIYDNGRQLGKKETLSKYFPEVYKVDFSSQYPTAMITFNLSPDTCMFKEFREYQEEYMWKNTGEVLWLGIPDKNCMKTHIIKVDLTVDGFLRSLLKDFSAKRTEIKVGLKTDPNNKVLYSIQWAIKVIMNSIYGFEGLATARWGDLAVAVATVGTCRWLIAKTEEYLGNSIIETDTDGIYVSEKPDIDALNAHLADVIHETFGVPCQMGLELDEYQEAFFYRSKNYILRETDGTVTRKGAVFKSSRHSPIYNKTLDILADGILRQLSHDELWKLVTDVKRWSNYGIEDFIMHTSYSKNPKEYANPNAMHPVLARQALKRLDVEIDAGDSLDYIVTRGKQYTIASLVTSTDQVDFRYYDDAIDKAMGVFGISNIAQPTLF